MTAPRVTEDDDLVCPECGQQLEVLVPPGGAPSEKEVFCVNPFCAGTDPHPDSEL